MMKIFGIDTPFYAFMMKAAQLFCLSMLWLLCSLPVITIGASSTALYYTAMKLTKGTEEGIATEFFHSFRTNFRQATILWLIQALIGAVLGSNLFYYWLVGEDGIRSIPFMLYPITALYLIFSLYLYPSLAKFENTIKGTIRFSVVLSLRNIGFSLLMALIVIIVVLISLAAYGFPLIVAPGVIAYGQAHLLHMVFDKFISNMRNEQSK